jgi:hypothetical protein
MSGGASRPDDPDNDDALAGFVDGLDHDTVLSTGAEDQFEARTVLAAPDPALLAMTPPPEAPVRKSVPKLLEANDIAPGFRAGVKLTRNALGGYEVQDLVTGAAFALNEFEGSLARMLNGQRPISDILESGRRLGIPINLESLQKFIQHLDGNGFLGNANEVDAKAAWASRGEWESSVRTLFQSGIRLLRQGKHAEAAGYFEALLEEDPHNIEARELLAMAHAGHAHEGARPPAMTGLSDTISVVAPYAPVPFGPQPVLLVPAPQPVRRSRFGVIAIVAITALVIGGGILASQLNAVKPKPPEVAVVTPPATLAIDAAPVIQPAIVIDAAPAPIAVAIPIDAAPAPVVVPIDAGTATVVKSSGDKPKPKPVVRPVVPKLEPTKLEAPAAGEVTAFLRAPRNVKKGDKLFEIVHFSGDPAAIKAAAAKVADMEKMAKEDPTTYEAFLADARKELETTRGATSSVVVAPRAGRATPHVKPGADVKAGQLLVVIE